MPYFRVICHVEEQSLMPLIKLITPYGKVMVSRDDGFQLSQLGLVDPPLRRPFDPQEQLAPVKELAE